MSCAQGALRSQVRNFHEVMRDGSFDLVVTPRTSLGSTSEVFGASDSPESPAAARVKNSSPSSPLRRRASFRRDDRAGTTTLVRQSHDVRDPPSSLDPIAYFVAER